MTRRDLPNSFGFFYFAQESTEAYPAAVPEPLPGTRLLTWQGDLSERMMDGAHRFVEGRIAESIQSRQRYSKRDLSSRAAYEQSVEANRNRLKTIAGVADKRDPVVMERFAHGDDSPLVAE